MEGSRHAPAKRRIVMTFEVHAECLRLDGAGAKNVGSSYCHGDFSRALLFAVLYTYVYIYC